MVDTFPMESLPELVLLKIFGFLTIEERKLAMLVNQRWHDLLQAPRFLKKMTLKLEHCWISPDCPPWTFLLNSNRRHFHLTLGEGIWIDGVVSELWKHLGQHIEVISFQATKNSLELPKKFLKYFPNLKRVEFRGQDLLFFLQIPDHIEAVHLNTINRCLFPERLEALRKMNHLKTLTAKVVIFDRNSIRKEALFGLADPLCDALDVLGVKVARIRPVNLLHLDTLSFSDIIDFRDKKIQHCDLILGSFNNLNKICLAVNADMSTDNVGCFFAHEPIPLKTVRKVWICATRYYEVEHCTKCMENVVESFPSFDCLRVHGQILDVQGIINAVPNPLRQLSITGAKGDFNLRHPLLEKLHVQKIDLTQFCDKELTNMPLLRKLSLGYCTLQTEGLMQLTKLCPAVEEAEFETEIPMEGIKIIEKNWPHLKRLGLGYHFLDEKKIVKCIAGTGFKELRECKLLKCPQHIPDHLFELTKFRVKMYQRFPTLRKFFQTSYANYCKSEYNISKYSVFPP